MKKLPIKIKFMSRNVVMISIAKDVLIVKVKIMIYLRIKLKILFVRIVLRKKQSIAILKREIMLRYLKR